MCQRWRLSYRSRYLLEFTGSDIIFSAIFAVLQMTASLWLEDFSDYDIIEFRSEFWGKRGIEYFPERSWTHCKEFYLSVRKQNGH